MSYTNSTNTINETRRRKVYPRAERVKREEPVFPERQKIYIHLFPTWINFFAVDDVVGVLYVCVDQLGKSIEFGIQWQFKD